MTKDIMIEAETRTDLGKNASRRLRSAGKLPAVLYGGGNAAQSLTVDPRIVESILHSETGGNTLFSIKIGAQGVLPGKVMIKQHRLDPVTDKLVHADFMRIQMDKAIRVQVAVHAVGIAKGVKLQGGILDHPLREVEVECLPAEIPERIDIDITELEINRSYRVSDLKAPAGIKILTDPHAAVVAVVAPMAEEVAAPVAAEGAAVAEAAAEPEVIKKGKVEGDEGAEAAPKKEEKKGAAKPEKK